jgi:hypothetical protein
MNDVFEKIDKAISKRCALMTCTWNDTYGWCHGKNEVYDNCPYMGKTKEIKDLQEENEKLKQEIYGLRRHYNHDLGG